MYAVEVYATVRQFVSLEGKSRREVVRLLGLRPGHGAEDVPLRGAARLCEDEAGRPPGCGAEPGRRRRPGQRSRHTDARRQRATALIGRQAESPSTPIRVLIPRAAFG